MAEAIILREHGGPTMLRPAVGDPGPGAPRIGQTAVGVSVHHCHLRSGLYRTRALTGLPAIEAARAGVAGFAAGDRIDYVTASHSGHASSWLLPVALAALPNGALRAEPDQALPLAEAARAPHLLESWQAEASLILLPQEHA